MVCAVVCATVPKSYHVVICYMYTTKTLLAVPTPQFYR